MWGQSPLLSSSPQCGDSRPRLSDGPEVSGRSPALQLWNELRGTMPRRSRRHRTYPNRFTAEVTGKGTSSTRAEGVSKIPRFSA